MSSDYKVIYRPPTESRNILLEICEGCTYGKCTFCRCASGKEPFCPVPLEKIEADLKELRTIAPEEKRIFLTGSNVLALETDHLIHLFTLIHSYLPKIEQISMYARAEDILNKDLDALIELKQLGLDTLYTGVESGSDQFLAQCLKGEDTSLLFKAFQTLEMLRIPYGVSCIIGLGGTGTWEKAGRATAAFLSKIHPESIRVMTLTVFEGTPLHQNVLAGNFIQQDRYESLREELTLIENLNIGTKQCLFVANHLSNEIPFAGFLPEDKQAMIKLLKRAVEKAQSKQQSSPLADNIW